MNIQFNQSKKEPQTTKLFESQQFGNQQQVSQEAQDAVDTTKEDNVFKFKSLQIEFSSGIIMGTINSNVDTKFGLKWHYQNSTSLETFIASVQSFIETSDLNINDADIAKLTQIYNTELTKK